MLKAMMVKMDELETSVLVEIAERLNASFDDHELLVANAATNVLESRMPSAEYVAFIEKLEAELIA